MKIFFFPRDKLFWKYHCGAVILLVAIQGVITVFWQEEKLFNALAGSVWLPLFTLGVLTFRYLYKTRFWHTISAARTIPCVLVYGLLMGAVVTILMLVITTPFFWSHLVNHPDVLAHKASVSRMLLQMFIGNTLQNQLLMGAWIFIYINIGNSRRAREAEMSNLRLQNSLREAQLANLTNQLNPHFLFNAINNIRFTIYEDAAKADAMLTGLSDMLRYSLERSRQVKVSLSEELEIISLYMDLIQVQMEERLVFFLDVAPSLHHCLIPPMVLQLLVENAVKHGIDKLRHGGRIDVMATANEQHIIFTVSNGCNENKPLLVGEADSNNIGIGLVNIQERLCLLYGEEASLRIEQASTRFSVILILPRETAL